MGTIALFALYYAAVTALINWILAKKSALFAWFIAVVASQTCLFIGIYLYDGYWDAWNDIVLVTTTAECILVATIVTIAFRVYKRRTSHAPT